MGQADIPAVTVEYKEKEWKELVSLTKQGDSQAQYEIGRRFLYGENAKQDYKYALQMISSAANQGFSQAQYTLGLMYEQGLGVNRDEKIAITWYEKAQLQGHSLAVKKIEELSLIDSDLSHTKNDHSQSDNTGFEMYNFEFVNEDDEELSDSITISDNEEGIIKKTEYYKARAVIEILNNNPEGAKEEINTALSFCDDENSILDIKRFMLSLLTERDCEKLSKSDTLAYEKIIDTDGEYKGGIRINPIVLGVGVFLFAGGLVSGMVPLLVYIVVLFFIQKKYHLFLAGRVITKYSYFIEKSSPYDVIGDDARALWKQRIETNSEEEIKMALLEYYKDLSKQRINRQDNTRIATDILFAGTMAVLGGMSGSAATRSMMYQTSGKALGALVKDVKDILTRKEDDSPFS